ncbi:MAG: DUF4388 domain-containing protein [Chloroflexi bacterium AL-W]|nr:DUF4388 domain-containing protein [Chloroflexi bacterium AL-N1]NOK68235.1 DUF4388 domain-containing protein [Chloroflexi bacterium AL-N10]NOK73881.1 DUF4388 domain-containing protein [Chloroflexi bacterium AL-N5]NOK82849.1 DUF4388 domain-containing protein [Chloroflexi bacterium AL-W]NOK90371.1 DUF4388 domain-containing protein [Chloroflexi bacterium AL-N15]
MQLEGMLDQFSLAELMAMIISSSVTGVLTIGPDGSIGLIYFRDGHPYHAITSNLTGFDAVTHLFEEKRASFCFTAGAVSPEETIRMDPWDLVTSAEQYAQMWSQMRPTIPDLDWVPVLLESQLQAQIKIREVIWPILATIDGQRSIAEIADTVGQIRIEVAMAMHELLSQGLVHLHPPTNQSAHPKLVQPVRPSGGFLGRFMTNNID